MSNAPQLIAQVVIEAAANKPANLRADLFDALAICTCSLDTNIARQASKAAIAIREAESEQLLLKEIIGK